MKRVLKVHPEDNVIVALEDINPGEIVQWGKDQFKVTEFIPVKHKFAEENLVPGDEIRMYGVLIGKAKMDIAQGARITIDNVVHDTHDYSIEIKEQSWQPPNTDDFTNRTFSGYHRSNGQVGTRNYWIVFPLVFCENRNIEVLQEAMLRDLGYEVDTRKGYDIQELIQIYNEGGGTQSIAEANVIFDEERAQRHRVFRNVDGIKFLTHQGGCGGIRQDSEVLCKLFAGYVANPNVAGATVLSLGCQNAQYSIFKEAFEAIPGMQDKSVYFLEQQDSSSEKQFIEEGIKKTFIGLMEANKLERKPAPLSKLVLGLECGGSDGFSGISANPALGYAADLLVALGGKAILSEFPELNGVEQELINRCVTTELAQKFASLMNTYKQRAEEVGSGFENNPSPGNIKDGLITDAMKSAGAAKKGGTSPIKGVLDYTEQPSSHGLNLLCTPGNDVESTTGLAGSGSNLIVFTTGLGTPTGNPITPTIKMASNTKLAHRMADIIDIDAGTIITGEDTIESKGKELLELLIQIASGNVLTKAERLGQDDFIPWKRGVSL